MSDRELREHFSALVADEPPLQLAIDPVVARGRRLRTHRRLAYATGSLGLAVIVAAAVVVPLSLAHDETKPTLRIAPVAASTDSSPSDGALSAEQRRMLDTIVRASPSGFTVSASSDRWTETGVEALADDAAGGAEPGRLDVGWSSEHGSYQLHPCEDPEHVQGATCTERTLADGSVLSLRGLVDYNGIQYVDVTLTHPDGTGVGAESGNFTITWPPPAVATAEQKRHLVHVSRPHPTYSVDELGDVVLAVDRALHH